MLSKTLGGRAEKVRDVFVSEFIASSLRNLRRRMERIKKESRLKQRNVICLNINSYICVS